MNPILPKTGCSPIGEPLFPSVVWGKACTTMFESFLHLRKSRGQSCEFLCACVTRGQQRRNNVSTFFSDDVTVRVRDFCDQAMRAQQPQATSHRRHFSALLLFVLGRRVEMETQVTIAKPVERKFPRLTIVISSASRSPSGLSAR